MMRVTAETLGIRQGARTRVPSDWQRLGERTLPFLVVLGIGLALGVAVLVASRVPLRVLPLVVMVLIAPFGTILFGDVKRALLAVIALDIPLQLDVNLGFRDDAAALGAVYGLNVSATTLALLTLYALWFFEALAKRDAPGNRPLRWNLPLLLYLGFAAASILVARDRELALYELFLLAQLALLYFYISNRVTTRPEILFCVSALTVGLLFEGALMVWLNFSHSTLDIAGIANRYDIALGLRANAARLGGTIGAPNNAAAYLGMLLTLALVLPLAPIRRAYKLLAFLALGLGGMALILTFSRGGWIGFLISSAFVLLATWRRGWLSARVLISIGLVLGALLLWFNHDILLRLVSSDQGAAYSRLPLIQLAWKLIAEHPFLGVGANNFAMVFKDFVTPDLAHEWLYTVHNKYLLVWSELGIGGLVAFIAFLFVTLRQGWKAVQLEDALFALLAMGLTGALLGHMAHMFVEVFNGRPVQQLLFVMAGLIAAICFVRSRALDNEAEA